MGTINYKTGDYITLGINFDAEDYEAEYINDFYSEAEEIISELSYLEHFKVNIEYGYYEDFCVTVDSDLHSIDDGETKAEYLAEIEDIRKILHRLLDETQLTVTFPGWCMGYIEDYKEASNYIDEVAETMKGDVDLLPVETYDEEREKYIYIFPNGKIVDNCLNLKRIICGKFVA